MSTEVHFQMTLGNNLRNLPPPLRIIDPGNFDGPKKIGLRYSRDRFQHEAVTALTVGKSKKMHKAQATICVPVLIHQSRVLWNDSGRLCIMTQVSDEPNRSRCIPT